MKKEITKKQIRVDKKEEALKYINLNSEDGCQQIDIQKYCDISSTLANSFLSELQIEGRVRHVKFHRFLVYKEITK